MTAMRKKAHGLAVLVVMLMVANSAIDLAALASNYAQFQFLRLLESGAPSAANVSTLVISNEMESYQIGLLQILLFNLTIICFLGWLHRAYRNLEIFGKNNNRFSPGWAVGWWFIPVANIFRPFQIMDELWQNSLNISPAETRLTPASERIGPATHITKLTFVDELKRAPKSIKCSWAAWIVSLFSAGVIGMTDTTIPKLMISDIAYAACAVFALAMVVQIDRRQESIEADSPFNSTPSGTPQTSDSKH